MRVSVFLLGGLVAMSSVGHAATPSAQPVKIAKAEAEGTVFEGPKVIVETHGSNITRDRVILNSSDKKLNSGMYKSGPSHFVTKGPYGVDEFMLFTSGSVTLTSVDGTVTQLNAGDAVTVPAEWEGTWDSPGYTKYYVIYDRKVTGQ
jgi:uncharacterized cupin superfamily protein